MLRSISLALALTVLAGPAVGQFVNPTQLTLRDGASNWFSVESPGCPIDVVATAVQGHIEVASFTASTLGPFGSSASVDNTTKAVIFARVFFIQFVDDFNGFRSTGLVYNCATHR